MLGKKKSQQLKTLLSSTLENDKRYKISDIRNLQYFYLYLILNKIAGNALQKGVSYQRLNTAIRLSVCTFLLGLFASRH